MAVTPAMIKELRAMTGAGMSACKEVLVEADGDMQKAVSETYYIYQHSRRSFS